LGGFSFFVPKAFFFVSLCFPEYWRFSSFYKHNMGFEDLWLGSKFERQKRAKIYDTYCTYKIVGLISSSPQNKLFFKESCKSITRKILLLREREREGERERMILGELPRINGDDDVAPLFSSVFSLSPLRPP